MWSIFGRYLVFFFGGRYLIKPQWPACKSCSCTGDSQARLGQKGDAVTPWPGRDLDGQERGQGEGGTGGEVTAKSKLKSS